MLSAAVSQGQPGYPWLVFIHGFSGDSREWRPVGALLSEYPQLHIDLPGHGGSREIVVGDFAGVHQALRATLMHYNILSYWLIGYSLGGRVAISWACEQAGAGLLGLITEGAHPGLCGDALRQARWHSDSAWAERFAGRPLDETFDAWYRQPVFAGLTCGARQALVALRKENSGPALARMLLATSLAVQPDYRQALRDLRVPFHYLCGERDVKFQAVADELAAPRHIIHAAGHNAHRENPESVAACLAHILRL